MEWYNQKKIKEDYMAALGEQVFEIKIKVEKCGQEAISLHREKSRSRAVRKWSDLWYFLKVETIGFV